MRMSLLFLQMDLSWFFLLQIVLVTLSAYYYRLLKVGKPELVYKQTTRNTQLLNKCPSLHQTFSPTYWAPFGHIQSLMFAIWVPYFYVRATFFHWALERATMTVPHDGGAYAMDSPVLTEELLDVIFPSTSTTPSRWSTLSLFASTSVINAAADRHRRALKSDNRAPIVIMLPGIVGKSDNPYITRLSIRFMMNGWRSVTKSWRGINCKLQTAKPEMWNEDAVLDLDHCVQQMRAKYSKDAPIFLLGFSYGGTVIAKYLGSDLHNNKPAGEKIAGAINVSGLVDFREISHDKGKHMRLPNPPYEAINLLILKKDMQIFGNFNWIIEQEGRRLQGKKEEKEAGEEEGEAVPSKSASNAVKANQPIEVEQNHHHQNQEPNRNNNEGTEASGYHTKRTATHTISNGPRFTEETYRRVQGAWTNSVYTDCVAPLVGISGSHEMYARMSEMYRTALPKVTRPMLCLMARDDPIAIERTLKHSLHLCQQSDSIIAAVTKGGGHAGFFEGVLAQSSLVDRAASEFIQAVLDTQTQALSKKRQ